jgi:hypothetical protein
VVCRGGDCGSQQKHPGTDHRGQLQRFREALGRDLVVSRCLDACEHSNVVVAVPGTSRERAGAEPVWIGEVLDQESTEDILEWIRAGGPDDPAEQPTLVQIKQFPPTRRNRHELDTEIRNE